MNYIASGLSVAGAACAALLVCALPAHGQWSAAPTVALGLAIPGGTLHDAVAEGIIAKAGLWMRAPRVPFGVTAEAMYTYMRGDNKNARAEDMHIGAVLVNMTTRRHEGRLDPYGILGGGWYLFSDPDARFQRRSAPGVNVGVGEVIAVGDRDYFIEVRLHAMRTTSMAGGSVWTTFLPIMAGVRF